MKKEAARRAWILETPNPEHVSFLSQKLNISSILATLLVNRGLVELDQAKFFLLGSFNDLPSPFLMKDMNKAVNRVISAIQNKESIFIYSDYDVDGVTAASSLICFFRELGIEVNYHIPHRLKDGYGLHETALREIKQRGGKVVITADCGISNIKEALVAESLGLDLIITDHHIIPPALPEAHAVLNPLRKESDFPDLTISGVGVVFYFMMALRSSLRNSGFFEKRKEPNLKNYLDFVALGTIADMVPLKGSNHVLVKEGLKILSQRKRPGIKALIQVSGLEKKDSIGTYEVGFQLAPRLNAGGRLAHAELSVKLLISTDFIEALEFAQKLNLENNQRRFLQEETLEQATQMIEKNKYHENKSIVLSSPHWHPGVIGIVASKLVEKYYRPTCLIAENEGKGKGSGRSIEALHLVDTLRNCQSSQTHGLFENFGGHKAAAGFSIRVENIELFRKQFEGIVSKSLNEEHFIQKIKVDLKLNMNEIHRKLWEELENLSPFGMGNPEPLFMTESHSFKINHSYIVGQKHLKFFLEAEEGEFQAIGFNMSNHFPEVSKIKSLCYSLGLNEWQGQTSLQLKIKNISF